MNKVQWAVGEKGKAPGKMAPRRGSLVLVSLLGWLLAMMPAHAEEPLLAAEYQPLVQKMIDAAKARDQQALARQIKYPFKREYPIPAIKSPAEMVARFDEVFDDAILNSIASSRAGQDWQAMGWRGIMLGSGEVWLDFDGKVIGINHQTAQAAKRKACRQTEKRSLSRPAGVQTPRADVADREIYHSHRRVGGWPLSLRLLGQGQGTQRQAGSGAEKWHRQDGGFGRQPHLSIHQRPLPLRVRRDRFG